MRARCSRSPVRRRCRRGVERVAATSEAARAELAVVPRQGLRTLQHAIDDKKEKTEALKPRSSSGLDCTTTNLATQIVTVTRHAEAAFSKFHKTDARVQYALVVMATTRRTDARGNTTRQRASPAVVPTPNTRERSLTPPHTPRPQSRSAWTATTRA